MDLLEYLVLASFAYTSALWRWAYRKFEQLTRNHMAALERRVKALEDKSGTNK